MPVAGALIGAAGAIGGAVLAGNAAKDASRTAAAASDRAAQLNAELAREQMQRAYALLEPDSAAGRRADAYTNALLFGEGAYNNAPAPALPAAGGPGQPTGTTYDLTNADWDAYYYGDHQGTGRSLASWGQNYKEWQQYLAQRRAAGDTRHEGQLHYEFDGRSRGFVPPGAVPQTPGAPGGSGSGAANTTVTRDQVMSQIQGSFPWTQSDAEFAGREGLATETRDRGLGLADEEYDALYDVGDDSYDAAMSNAQAARDRGYTLSGERRADSESRYGAQRADAVARADQRYGDLVDLAEDEYSDVTARAGATRGEREAEAERLRLALRNTADSNFDRALGYLDEDFATRRGYTDAAVAKRAELNDIYQQKARDRIASMLGVNGQVGKAARASAEAANELDLEFAGTERAWRNEDYAPYATGRLAADAARGDVYLGAEQGYGAGLSRAIDLYDDDMQGATATRYGRRNAATSGRYDEYDDAADLFYGQMDDAGQRYYSDVAGYDDDYYGRADTALANRADLRFGATQQRSDRRFQTYGAYDAARLNNYNAQQAGRRNAYDIYRADLDRLSDRGFTARTGQASAGQTYAQAATSANNLRAAGQIEAANQQGAIQQQMYSDIAGALGSAWANAQSNNRKSYYQPSRVYNSTAYGSRAVAN